MSASRFPSPPELENFKIQVWATVRQVPSGSVVTYGQIANYVGTPAGMTPERFRVFGPRWVGSAIATCPPGIPWHRVINSQGKISLPGAAGLEQRALLEAEGVQFDNRDKIDLKRYGWRPSATDQMALF